MSSGRMRAWFQPHYIAGCFLRCPTSLPRPPARYSHQAPFPTVRMRCRLFGFWLWLCGLAIFKSQEVSTRLATGHAIPCAVPDTHIQRLCVPLCVACVLVCWWPLPVVCRHFHNVCLWPVGVCWFSFAFYFSHQQCWLWFYSISFNLTTGQIFRSSLAQLARFQKCNSSCTSTDSYTYIHIYI